MIIYPAIDLRGGKVVRLKEGDPNRQTVFGEDPVATAQQWIAEGAQWLHVVNLDGAFSSANDNGAIMERIAASGVPVQFGGGLRTLDDVRQALERGAARVVLGTIAIEQPDIVDEALGRWGAERLCVALDTRDGKVATRGWQKVSDVAPETIGQQMAARGLRYALFTDVARDGGLSGVNVDSTVRLASDTGLRVIASGGVNSLDDIRALAASGVIDGAVVGMALYHGRLSLSEALAAAGGR